MLLFLWRKVARLLGVPAVHRRAMPQLGALALGEEQADAAPAAGDGGGVGARRRPALAEDRVRPLRRVAAQRQSKPEQITQRRRDDVGARRLRRAHDDHPGRAASRDEIAQQLGELLTLPAAR
jgi:hypothetical protein